MARELAGRCFRKKPIASGSQVRARWKRRSDARPGRRSRRSARPVPGSPSRASQPGRPACSRLRRRGGRGWGHSSNATLPVKNVRRGGEAAARRSACPGPNRSRGLGNRLPGAVEGTTAAQSRAPRARVDGGWVAADRAQCLIGVGQTHRVGDRPAGPRRCSSRCARRS